MADNKGAALEVEKTGDEPNKPAADFVTDEMKELAEAQAKASHAKSKEEETGRGGVGVMRKQGGRGVGTYDIQPDESVPYPVEVHGEDFEFYGPQGAGATIPEGTDVAPYSSDQEFMIQADKVKYLSFDKPGRNLPKKRLYNIKGIHADGRIVQLPFEAQIQNNAGGDPEDAIGLRRYQRKGIMVLIDWMTMIPVYCAAWDCWAKSAPGGSNFVGFCSFRHAKHTLPNKFRQGDDGEIAQGLFSAGVTAQNVWNA